MMHSKLFDAPRIDSGMIDYYLARGRRERARAIAEMVRSVFSSPAGLSADVHALPAREPARTERAGDRARAA
jgi:hypothetical protein